MNAIPTTREPSGSTTTAAAESTRWAPFRVDRLASIPAAAVRLSPAVRPLLDEYYRLTTALAEHGTLLSDAIYPLVPLVDARTRRVLLAARRQVHNSTCPAPEALDTLRTAGVDSDALAGWTSTRRAVDSVEADLVATLDRVAAVGDELLIHQLNRPDVARALAVCATEFSASLGKESLRPGTRGGRSAVMYLVRAALKPSPLSSLTTVNLHPADALDRHHVTVPVGIAQRVVQGLSCDPRLVECFDYEASPTLPAPDGGRWVVVPGASASDRFPWRGERIVDAGSYATEVDLLQGVGRRSGSDLARLLGGADGPARVARLCRMGLLRPVLPWARGADEPLRDLARSLRRSGGARGDDWARMLDSVSEAAASVSGADAVTRRERLVAIRRDVDALTGSARVPSWDGPVLTEDVTSARSVGDLPDTVRDDLTQLARVARSFVFRSHLYDVVLAAVKAEIGIGGHHHDAVALLRRLQGTRGLVKAIREAQGLDMAYDPTDGRRRELPVGRTSAPPALAVMYQLAARDRSALERGDYHLVVNQFGNAHGGLLTRFGPVIGRDTMREIIWPWLTDLRPDCQVRTVTFSTDVSGVQHAGAGFLPELEWDGTPEATPTPGDHAGPIRFSDLGIIHRADNDTLEFVDARGDLVAPVYTGIVPASLTNGPTRLACALMDPWVDGTPLTRTNHPFLRSSLRLAEPIIHPRICVGRVVTARRRWLIPTDQIALPLKGEGDTGYLIRLDGWRRSLDLPADVFFLAVSDDMADDARRKPTFLDFASPHLVQAAVPLIKGSRYVRFEETLPALDEHWVPGPDGGYACEHLSFLAWERPAGGAT